MSGVKNPHVFISYSWSSATHQLFVKGLADRLLDSGVQVTIDIYDLREGMDKNHFMEQMVASDTITHVLVVSDKEYASKADSRTRGVGTESQIISEKVYAKVSQTKFIPLVCEFDAAGEAFLPTYFQSRIWVDISSAEALHRNWEQLIRLLYGKPLHLKPSLGVRPLFLDEAATPPSLLKAKMDLLVQSLKDGRRTTPSYRTEFLEKVYGRIEELRLADNGEPESGRAVVNATRRLKEIRNAIVDWVIAEANWADGAGFDERIIEVFERTWVSGAKNEPWSESKGIWDEAYKIFRFDLFLYVVAALLKNSQFSALHRILTEGYLLPKGARVNGVDFEKFDDFYASSTVINSALVENREFTYHHPVAELLKRDADRTDITFDDIMEADLVAFLMALVSEDLRWYPQTIIYAQWSSDFPLFLKATRKRGVEPLLVITGMPNLEQLKESVVEGYKRLGVNQWNHFRLHGDLLRSLNIEKWGSI